VAVVVGILVIAMVSERYASFFFWISGFEGRGHIVDDLNSDPTVREYLGKITDCRLDIGASVHDDPLAVPALLPFRGRWIFRVESSKGRGWIEVTDTEYWSRRVLAAYLSVEGFDRPSVRVLRE
jgi:hypothetical protein